MIRKTLVFGRAVRNTLTIKRYNSNIKSYGIIGVPFEKGQKKHGVANGPKCIRDAGLLEALRGADVADYGDVCGKDVSSNGKAVSEAVSRVLMDGRIPITLGGDHSIALGTVHATVKNNPETVVIWIDAHADLNVPDKSPSGNQHGMVLAMLAKELEHHWDNAPHLEWTGAPVFSLSSLVYIGLRSVDQFETETIDKYNITAHHMYDIDRVGAKALLNRALKIVDPKKNKPLFISFDIDSLDPEDAPSTGTPVKGGLTLREGIQLVELVAETGRLTGIDLVEVNPKIGDDTDVNKTTEAAVQVLKAAVGLSRGSTDVTERRKVKRNMSNW